MLFKRHNFKKKLLLSLFLVFSLAFLAACSGGSDNTNEEEEQMEEGEQMEDSDHVEGDEHDDDGRIPNPEGAAISLLAPADGATFAAGEEVIVEVQVENFTLGEDGNHWHVYVDGTSWGMVMGENTSQAIRGLEPGEHEIEVYIAGGDHIDYQVGDSVQITVE